MVVKDNGADLDGRMTVAACREVSTKCSENLRARITDIKIDLALIKKHLGINGQYQVTPFKQRRDGESETHEHLREADVVVSHKGNISFPTPPKWLIAGFVMIMLLAGAGLLLIIQTRTDLQRIRDFQTLNNTAAVEGQQRIERKVDAQ